jgi:hypothetical protein
VTSQNHDWTRPRVLIILSRHDSVRPPHLHDSPERFGEIRTIFERLIQSRRCNIKRLMNPRTPKAPPGRFIYDTSFHWPAVCRRALWLLISVGFLCQQTQLSAAAAIQYSTYFGGVDHDGAYAVAVDRDGNVFVGGGTSSTNFPILNAFQPEYADGDDDAFLAKFDSEGRLLFPPTSAGKVTKSSPASPLIAKEMWWWSAKPARSIFPAPTMPSNTTTRVAPLLGPVTVLLQSSVPTERACFIAPISARAVMIGSTGWLLIPRASLPYWKYRFA